MPEPLTSPPVRCPCGSRERFDACCGPLITGRAGGSPTAQTAERLMRSRYSAYATGATDYLLATWHPSTRPRTLELDPGLEWLRLEIVSIDAGGPDDTAGIVEFIAHYWFTADHQRGQLHECSAFVRERGQWFYVGER